MEGILRFTTDVFVCKKQEYTKEEFVKELNDENYSLRVFDIEKVYEALCRYYPKGTEDSEFEFGKGNGVYQFTDKKSKGAFEVWCIDLKSGRTA